MPTWITADVARVFHSQLLAEHGGLPGPGSGDLEGTLARPQNLFAYSEPQPSLMALAASYGWGIARGHCFADANKRLALAVTDVFLRLNGYELTATEIDAATIFRDVAAGFVTELDLATWIETNSRQLV